MKKEILYVTATEIPEEDEKSKKQNEEWLAAKENLESESPRGDLIAQQEEGFRTRIYRIFDWINLENVPKRGKRWGKKFGELKVSLVLEMEIASQAKNGIRYEIRKVWNLDDFLKEFGRIPEDDEETPKN